MDMVTPPLAVETDALRKAYAAFNRNDIPEPLTRLTLRSSGPNLPSFRAAELITGTRESRRICRNRARAGPKYTASRSGSLSLAIRSSCLFMPE
jgi:hypothetical protein